MPIRIECVQECGNHLGEGPVWDVDEGGLYRVDGTGRRVGNPSIGGWNPRTGKVDTLVARARRRRAGIAPRRRSRPGARRRLLLLRFRRRAARAYSTGGGRPAPDEAERRQVRSSRTLLRRRNGRQRRAEDLRAVAARPRPSSDEGRRRHHLHQRSVLESGRQDVLSRRHFPGRVLGVRLRPR